MEGTKRTEMRESVIFFIFLLGSLTTYAQQWQTKSGEIFFEATESGFEPVRARNKKAAVLIDPASRKIAVLVKVRDFEFRVGLMQEHFNENYLESDRYPYMRFEGSFLGTEPLSGFEGSQEVEGILKLHGQNKKLKTETRWIWSDEELQIRVAFEVRPADFGIKIPRLVIKKIAEEVEVEAIFRFELMSE